MPTGQIFINGKWQAPLTGETYTPINPATEEAITSVAKGDERDIDAAVGAARKAFDDGPWPRLSPHERGRLVWKLGELIQQNLDEMAKLESLCTGKTLFDSGKVEIPFAAEVFRYYASCATTRSRSRCASPSVSSAPSSPGTSRSCSRRGSSARRWPPATRSCSNRRRRRR